MGGKRIVIVGAGIGGLSAAVDLASRGFEVTVCEKHGTPGGKMRETVAGGKRIDAGPTVLTMRGVFDRLFERAGARLEDYLTLRPAETLARHAFEAGGRLDLFADDARSAAAIGVFAGAKEARAYLAFRREAESIFRILDNSFIRGSKPNLPQLMWRIGLHRVHDLQRINPYQTLWNAVSRHFADPRLRQLFARYATYCGSSPFLAPATLMLISDVERQGVWLVDGGMYRIAVALETLAKTLGARFRYSSEAVETAVENRRVTAIFLRSGERIDADAVVVNADAEAVASGGLGTVAASAVRQTPERARSLSAMTWAIHGTADGFPLSRHTIFFPKEPYASEFDAIFKHGKLPVTPAVYICAQDRDAVAGGSGTSPVEAERFLCIVNAPSVSRHRGVSQTEIEACEKKTFALMQTCGLDLRVEPQAITRTAPADFERMFPGTGGAIYGRASHGWMASFRRQGARSRIPGLYFVGGSAHPGAGVPMAMLSGQIASKALMADFASMRQSRGVGMPGGISMPSAATGVLD